MLKDVFKSGQTQKYRTSLFTQGCYGSETYYCLSLLPMARMKMTCILKKCSLNFSNFQTSSWSRGQKMYHRLLFLVKKLISFSNISNECYGMSKGHWAAFLFSLAVIFLFCYGDWRGVKLFKHREANEVKILPCIILVPAWSWSDAWHRTSGSPQKQEPMLEFDFY